MGLTPHVERGPPSADVCSFLTHFLTRVFTRFLYGGFPWLSPSCAGERGHQKGEPLLPKRKLLSDRGLQAPGPGPSRWGAGPRRMTAHALLCAYRNITEMMTTVSLQIVGIIEPIIQHADWFFPGGTWGGQ